MKKVEYKTSKETEELHQLLCDELNVKRWLTCLGSSEKGDVCLEYDSATKKHHLVIRDYE